MIDSIGSAAQQESAQNQSVSSGLPSGIAQAIKTAATRTGVDFSYLMNKASQESSFDPNAKAGNSSATGLFQFTSQTWLRMVKSAGDQYGLGSYAAQITVDSNGTAHVANAAAKQAILNLRKDPTISAEMAGELDKQNLGALNQSVGGKIGATDLYLAHFLGAAGASDFISEMRANPNASAADVLPEAASANSSVFYTSSGQPRSLKQIYQHFAAKFDAGSSATMVASVAPATTSASSMQVASAAFSANAAAALNSGNATMAGAASAVIGATQAGTTSSLVATMILAQMNIDDKTSASLFDSRDADNTAKHKNAQQAYSAIG